MISVVRYTSGERREWDEFVANSRNGTFLFCRDYMEYHSDRFDDHSLLFYLGGSLLALLPAHQKDLSLFSHRGLSYGGFVVDERMTAPLMMETLGTTVSYLKQQGLLSFSYKMIPHIYHRVPSEEDRFALYEAGAALSQRELISVVALAESRRIQARRRRGAKSATRHGICIEESSQWPAYWPLLSRRLDEQYGATPVHSLQEIEYLAQRFPEHIRLFTCSDGNIVVGGAVIYESDRVARAQYIAANDIGLESGALDLLFSHLIENVFAHKRYFDFGTSHEPSSGALNTGLIDQKEGFGARTITNDTYLIDLKGR